MAVTEQLVAEVIDRGVRQLVEWDAQLGRIGLPRVDGTPVFDLAEARFYDADACFASPLCGPFGGGPPLPPGHRAVLASSRLDPARPEDWERVLG